MPKSLIIIHKFYYFLPFQNAYNRPQAFVAGMFYNIHIADGYFSLLFPNNVRRFKLLVKGYNEISICKSQKTK